jgi:hypothetical protein
MMTENPFKSLTRVFASDNFAAAGQELKLLARVFRARLSNWSKEER